MTLLTDKKKSREKALNQNATALRRFAAALGDRSNTPVNVLLIGDSITEGENTATVSLRWASVFRDTLRAQFPTPGIPGGKGFIPPYRDSPSMPQPSTLSRTLTKGGNGQGLGARISVLTTIGDTQKFTVTSVTSVDVVYAKIGSGGGAFTTAYSSDAGTTWSSESGAVSCDGAASFIDQNYQRITFPRRGDYIVRLTCSTANAHIGGIVEYDGDEGTAGSEMTTGKGIRFYEAGHYGSTTTQQAAYAYVTRQNRQVAPALVVIALATNDYAGNIDPATSKTNLQTIITNVKAGVTQAGVPAASFVLFAFNQRTGSFTYPWSTYVDKMHEIAVADDHVTVCDLTQRLAPISDNTLGMFADAVHPNAPKGHAYYAAALAQQVCDGVAQRGSLKHGNESHTAPLALAVPVYGYKAGGYIGNAAPVGNITTQPVNGDLRLAPMLIKAGSPSVAFDRVSTYVATAGSVGALARIVIYADNGFGYPGALTYDSGQIAAVTSTAEAFAAVSLSLAPGLYWTGVVTQGAPATTPIYVGVTGRSPFISRQNVQAASGSATAYQQTSVTGAPTDPFPTTIATVGSAVDALLRVA